MNLIILWKENINLFLSIIDQKERSEDCFFEDKWVKKLTVKIKEIKPDNIVELIHCLHDIEITKKAFKNSLIDLKYETDDILKKYDNFICSEDERNITYIINNKNEDRNYYLRLEEVFCIDNESIVNREIAIEKSTEWLQNKLVNYDFDIRQNDGQVLYMSNEETEIDTNNKEVKKILQELENDFRILTEYYTQTIAFKEYRNKRGIIPEILAMTEGMDSFLKEPTEKAVHAFSTILKERSMLKLLTINKDQNKFKL